ncbi:AbrB/MazE/SpoVT family DNA-binding domain-containing protein [Novispirillum sp. DQ9]|uniref:AbrB/MazE/SpoVT family DNA-binding domain-containing protein n=1 Tax=Novispirillum sp. DQ9 TaxID=3398612 RepID=UPI003C7A7DDB
MAITSKLTSQAQAVVPPAVRAHLGVGPGDEVEYDLKDGFVILRRKEPTRPAGDDPFATFGEWSSAADAAAYDDPSLNGADVPSQVEPATKGAILAKLRSSPLGDSGFDIERPHEKGRSTDI